MQLLCFSNTGAVLWSGPRLQGPADYMRIIPLMSYPSKQFSASQIIIPNWNNEERGRPLTQTWACVTLGQCWNCKTEWCCVFIVQVRFRIFLLDISDFSPCSFLLSDGQKVMQKEKNGYARTCVQVYQQARTCTVISFSGNMYKSKLNVCKKK